MLICQISFTWKKSFFESLISKEKLYSSYKHTWRCVVRMQIQEVTKSKLLRVKYSWLYPPTKVSRGNLIAFAIKFPGGASKTPKGAQPDRFFAPKQGCQPIHAFLILCTYLFFLSSACGISEELKVSCMKSQCVTRPDCIPVPRVVACCFYLAIIQDDSTLNVLSPNHLNVSFHETSRTMVDNLTRRFYALGCFYDHADHLCHF